MLEILYEDNHLIAINKPAGILTQPSGTEQESLEVLAKEWLKQKYAKPGNVFLHAVHRLDKPVSGIVLFAKTSKALSRVNEQLREKKMVKTYFALLEGKLSPSEGVLEHYLAHDEFQSKVVSKDTPGSKLARLSYRTIGKFEQFSEIEITLETGRYHQIRAQLAAAGFPIVGDQKYGSKRKLLDNNIALHHGELKFIHPVTGVLIEFRALKNWNKILKKD